MRLKNQISQCEERINAERKLVIAQYHKLKAAFHKKLISPYTLSLFFAGGFLLFHKKPDEEEINITDKQVIVKPKIHKTLLEKLFILLQIISFLRSYFFSK